ncbi:hypothetical protein M3Y97_01065100 [Aphelenchoides bicaudatus]|nr:hypothetical protein M3Y97_01065100 [Aphelenchoides bicaudatus]
MSSDQNNSQTSPPPPSSNPSVVYPNPYPQLSYGQQGYIAPPPAPGVYPQFYPQGQPVYPATIAYPPSNTFVPGQTYVRQHVCVAPPYNEREFTCLCGMHVHKAIIIIAIITIVLGVAEMVLEIVASDVIKVLPYNVARNLFGNWQYSSFDWKSIAYRSSLLSVPHYDGSCHLWKCWDWHFNSYHRR